MIPWESFKTPQDAYEWAKVHFKDLALIEVGPPSHRTYGVTMFTFRSIRAGLK